MSPHPHLPDAAAIAALSRRTLSPAGMAGVSAFLLASRHACGAFCDRAGTPDLYYTVFGLDGLMALDAAPADTSALRAFLAHHSERAATGTFTDCVSYIHCLRCLNLLGDSQPGDTARFERHAAHLQRFRSADGGYSHEREHADAGTVYAAYLVAQAYREASLPWPHAEPTLAALKALRTPDGGYANHREARSGNTAATAAAAVLFARHGARDRALEAASYLAGLRHPDGGYRAAPQVRRPDLLATATALYAESLCTPDTGESLFYRTTAAFIEALWHDNGGFCGQRDDPLADVEYTFYALLALGALAARHEPQ